jgi:OmpA-OmpF porin, OOP family
MRSMIVALVAVLLFGAAPAFAAGGDKGDWELGAYYGFGWLDDYGMFRPDDDNLYGARLGMFITKNWGLELSGQRMATDTEFEILGVPDEDMKFNSVRLNLLYNFGEPGNGIRPFLTAGLGSEKVSVEDFGESCDISWNAGAGLRWFLSSHWNVRLEGRYVSVKVGDEIDESQKNTEATIGLGWIIGGDDDEVAPAAVIEQRANQAPSVSCSVERAEVLPGEAVIVRVTASDPEGDPLSLDWSANMGRVSGSNSGATYDFAGVTAPATAVITVRASDNHGNSTSSDCSVRLLEPARRAEAVSCVAEGFPRNLARLSNVDKACLDDVAQRLGSDPRARVIVIGHADSHESSMAVAQRRADAVKDYLVKERSIEESRISTRSAGATRPSDSGTDSANRRVEVWFVPEGATEP